MPLSFEIFPKRGLAVITYSGVAGIAETGEVFAQYAAHPDAAPGQKHLLDLSRVTDVEQDFLRLMAFQARAAGAVGQPVMPAMLVYYAPTPISQKMANMAYRSWNGVGDIALAVVADEAEALGLVGCSEARIADLKRRVAEE